MARKSPQRPNAEEPQAGAEEVATDLDARTAADPAGDERPAQTAADEPDSTAADEVVDEDVDEDDGTDEHVAVGGRTVWIDTRVDPVEIALPGGVGYTLRAYRLSNELAPTDIEGREEDDDLFAVNAGADVDDDDEVVILDEEYAALLAEDEEDEDESDRARKADKKAKKSGKSKKAGKDDDADDDADDATADRVDAGVDGAADGAADVDGEPGKADKADVDGKGVADHDEDDEAATVEDVPFFLTHRGKLLIFKSPESLVSFVRSGAPHDLVHLDTWATLAERIQPADVVATEDDSYELDLVVENLRGGNDTWDFNLLIRAGEIARDLGYALRLPQVMGALSAGSPLDDLDDALRAAAGGGIGGFMARRRLRRIGAQQASLGWRTIIGKISAAVDWRD